jgi:hypothetical protein
MIFVQYRRQNLPLVPSDTFFRGLILLDTIILWGVRHVPHERVVARRVRPDHRRDAGVGAGDGQPGRTTRKGRSLAADQPCASRAFLGGRGTP